MKSKCGLRIVDHIPEGWKPLKGALTAPRGYKWIYNGESLFSGKRKTALVPISLLKVERTINVYSEPEEIEITLEVADE